jgi:hypothetical protein
MEELLAAIEEAIRQAAQHETHVPDWQPGQEIQDKAEVAGQYHKLYSQGVLSAADVIADCEKYAAKMRQAILDTPLAMNYFGPGSNPTFGLKCELIALELIAAHFAALGKPSAGEEPGAAYNTRAWALFYHYLHRAGEYLDLSNASGRKLEALQEIAEEHGIGQDNFYQTFNAIGRNRDKNPLRNPENLKAAIELLEARKPFNAKALELAKADLEKMK